jgi:hypothetical protein
MRFSGIPALCSFLICHAAAKGITVRFLASPQEDSIVRYAVYRSGSAQGADSAIGQVSASPYRDTLGYSDTTARKGESYFYTIRAVNAAGLESDPSEATQIGFPVLSLPDTLRPEAASRTTSIALPETNDPLRGSTPLSVALKDSSRFTMAFDLATRTLTFRSRSGKADTGAVIARAEYFGKFEDRDTLLIMVAASPGTSLTPALQQKPAGISFPALHSPRSGPMAILNLPGPGRLEILTPMGSRMYSQSILAPRPVLLWNGADNHGHLLGPGRYLLLVRDETGSVREAGAFTLSR